MLWVEKQIEENTLHKTADQLKSVHYLYKKNNVGLYN